MNDIERIRKWLEDEALTLDDLGFDPGLTLEDLDATTIQSILDIISDQEWTRKVFR